MGDRRTAQIVTSHGSLYVYSHWGGSGMPAVAEEAIVAAKERWGDEPYAVRIIVDQLTKPGRDQETGYGLLLRPDCEDEYNSDEPSVIIDLLQRTLVVYARGDIERAAAFERVVAEGG